MKRFKEYFSIISEFGVRYFMDYHIRCHGKNNVEHQRAVLRFLSRNLVINTSPAVLSTKEPSPQNIWVCWWQGEEQMPTIVGKCYRSIQNHANGHPVILITKDNYRKYVKFPIWVEEKFANGTITITHLSDLLRIALLRQYGGLWMDATLLVTSDLPQLIPPFFTIRQPDKCDGKYVSRYRWTGFCIGGSANNPLWSAAYDMLIEQYWRKYNRLVNYFILDYVLEILYSQLERIRLMIDTVPYSNPDLAFIQENVSQDFDPQIWDDIRKNTSIFKLSWKIWSNINLADSSWGKQVVL